MFFTIDRVSYIPVMLVVDEAVHIISRSEALCVGFILVLLYAAQNVICNADIKHAAVACHQVDVELFQTCSALKITRYLGMTSNATLSFRTK